MHDQIDGPDALALFLHPCSSSSSPSLLCRSRIPTIHLSKSPREDSQIGSGWWACEKSAWPPARAPARATGHGAINHRFLHRFYSGRRRRVQLLSNNQKEKARQFCVPVWFLLAVRLDLLDTVHKLPAAAGADFLLVRASIGT